MEWHQELQRERKSPLFSLNNTMPRPYYVLGLSEVVIAAPDLFSSIVVCIKPLSKDWPSSLQIYSCFIVYLQERHHPLFIDLGSPFYSVYLYSFSPSRETGLFVVSVKGRLVIYWRWVMDSLQSITSTKKLQSGSSSRFDGSKVEWEKKDATKLASEAYIKSLEKNGCSVLSSSKI